ncbi:hypothetical protein BH09BAC6_BH09BAC6_06480 [soil metagenome]
MHSDKLLQKLIDDYWFNKFLLAEKFQQKNTVKKIESVNTVIETQQLADLSVITKNAEVGEFIILLAAYGVLLQKYFSLQACLVCSPDIQLDQNRTKKDKVLFYAHSVAVGDTIKEVIQNVKTELERVNNHKSYDYLLLKESFDSTGINEEDLLKFAFSYSRVNNVSKFTDEAGFQLFIDRDMQNNILLNINYDSSQYDPTIVSQFAEHFVKLIANIKANLDVPFNQLVLLSDEESHTIKHKFNSHKVSESPYLSIIDLFKNQVVKSPGSIALKAGNNQYTYKELDEKTDQLSAYLVNVHQIKADELIGLIASKTEWMIIGILCILKSGGAFVPVEPSQPTERTQHMLNDAGINVLLLESENMFDFGWFKGSLVVTDIETDGLSYNEFPVNAKPSAENLAYVIYTSGTTGKPKGVMINCGSVVNYASWVIENFHIGANDSSLVLASLAFDLAYTSVWSTLLCGGALHLAQLDYGSAPDQLLQYMAENKISFIKTTPSLFYMLTHVPFFNKMQTSLSLRLIVLGGEFIRKEDIDLYKSLYPETQFVNHYGPTESTVGCIANNITDGKITDPYSNLPIIGKPIKNCEILIMNENMTLTPIGLEGEICVGGDGLARGYLNNADLTAVKFVDHPYRTGEKLYRTGDYGKWTNDGFIIIHGRKDNQVKIRGHRVELGEIERQLLQFNLIENAVVIARPNNSGDKRIIAYYKASQLIDESALREFIAANLPAHMVPEYFIGIKEIPITANGKTAYEKLPSPDQVSAQIGADYIYPRNEAEDLILKVWREVLDKKVISMSDNFFDVGGNSLYLIKISSILAETFPDLTIVDLFNYTTIEKLASFIAEKEDNTSILISGSTVSLPNEYFVGFEDGYEESEKSDLQFQFRDELLTELKNTALAEGVEIYDLLISMFTYAIFEISGQKDITIQTIAGSKNTVFLQPVSIDFDTIDDPSALFRMFVETNGSLHATDKVEFEKIKNIRFKDRSAGTIVPLVFRKESISGAEIPPRIFDLILEIDDTNPAHINCVLEYNTQLQPSLMEDFADTYINNLSILLRVEN